MLAPHSDPTVASVFAPRTTIDADGTVIGYASLFGEIDQARDMVLRGAFAETLRLRGPRRVPMLFQHDPSEPVGIWLELREDHRGLFARGRLIPEVARGRELLALLRAGAIDGLSIGFKTARARIDPKTRVRSLIAVDLWEISIVTFPLLSGARVHAVKEASSPPRPSRARTRAEAEWGRLVVASQRVRPEVAGPMTGSAKQSRPATPMSGSLRRFASRDDGNGTRLARVHARRIAGAASTRGLR